MVRVICAWCKQQGRPQALLREVEPLDDLMETHGICWLHQLELMAQIATRQGPRRTPLEPAAERAESLMDAQGPPPSGEPSNSATDIGVAYQRLGQWLEEGRYRREHLFPALAEGHFRLTERLRAAERTSDELQERIRELRGEVTHLASENRVFRERQGQLAELLHTLLARILEQTIQPVQQVIDKFRARSTEPPGSASGVSPAPSG